MKAEDTSTVTALNPEQIYLPPSTSVSPFEIRAGSCWAVTTHHGLLIEASRTLSRLLGVSRHRLRGLDLYSFFEGGREFAWEADSRPGEAAAWRHALIRPRDRQPVSMRVAVGQHQDTTLVWLFHANAPHDPVG